MDERSEEATMNLTSRTIFIISGDPALAQGCIDELSSFGGRYRTPVVVTVEQARKRIGRSAPAAVFLMNRRSTRRMEAKRWNRPWHF